MLGVNRGAIHLASEVSAGATTFALQAARECIAEGGRVLWASEEMPDVNRFGQIFSSLSPHQSSLFHAMTIAGSMDDVVSQLIDTAGFLPNVRLLIIDDWAPRSGKVEQSRKKEISRLAKSCEDCAILITSSMYSDASGEQEFKVRGGQLPEYETWKLYKGEMSKRILLRNDEKFEFLLEDDGFS